MNNRNYKMNFRKILGKIYVPIKYNLFKYFPIMLYPILIKLTYRIEMGKKLNISKPKTIDEKIQWLKLYDKNPLKTQLADKYLVRDYVKKIVGEKYLIPLIGVWDNFDDIDFNSLPERFVLKATHGCGCNIIVKDKTSFDEIEGKKLFTRWLQTNYAYFSGELQYLNIKPRILAEEYIENSEEDLYDYKVFCFNGKAKYIMFLNERNKGLKMVFYNTKWEKQDFVYSYPKIDKDIEKPTCLSELINIAEKLSAPFAMARVDFYILNNKTIKFGEITFASAGGFCKWKPEEYAYILGEQLDISR